MSASGRLAKPGELRYRAGTYESFLTSMRREAKGLPALATLNLAIESDFTNALMSGWARVCDVLSFYQERIANEGYLPTAVEPASILWLAAEIGVRQRPAVGAEVQLSLQLVAAAGQPDSLIITPGPSLAVQNAPSSTGELPVVFECAQRRELKPIWNALAPVIPRTLTPPAVWPGCRSLRLVGTSLGLRPGAALLLAAGDANSWLAIADTVQADRTRGCTLVTWREPLPPPKENLPYPVTAVTHFTRSAGLFGRTAMAWADVAEDEKATIGVRAGGVLALSQSGVTADPAARGPALWERPIDAPPPPDGVQALLGIGGDAVLAGNARGLFRSDDRGATWQALALPQPKGWNDVLSLHQDETGTLYVGTAAGAVLRSADDGESWTIMTQTVLPGAVDRQGVLAGLLEDLHIKERPPSPVAWNLASPVRAITSLGGSEKPPSLYIGTDQGVFFMGGDAAPWQPFNEKLPGLDPKSGGADVAVFALALVEGEALVAATNRGAFWTPVGAAQWSRLELTPFGSACSSLAVDSATIFVGTPEGVKSFAYAQTTTGSIVPGRSWPAPPILSLAMSGGTLFSATEAGIQFLADAAREPNPAPPSRSDWESLDVQDLSLFRIDTVFVAGLDTGTVTPGLRGRFERFGILLDADIEIRPLYTRGASASGRIGWELREAPPSARIFRVYEETPLRVTQLVRNRSEAGDRLVATGFGPVASLPLGPVLNEEWPDLAIGTGQTSGDPGVAGAEIFLDRKIEGVEEGSRFVLVEAGSSLTVQPEVHEVIASEPILKKAYGKQGIVTRVVVKPTEALLAADLRTTEVYLVDRPVGPFTASSECLDPLAGDVITLPGVHSDLAPGRSIEVSGPRPGAVVLSRADMPQEPVIAQAAAEAAPALDQQIITSELRATFAAAGLKLSPAASVQVPAPGARWLVRDGDLVWRIDLDGGAAACEALTVRQLTLYELISPPAHGGNLGQPAVLRCGDEVRPNWRGALKYQGAASSQPAVGEIAKIAKVATDTLDNVTVLTLTRPLKNPYDGALCRICANVVRATQGETVPGEVLGSGQPALSGQSFTLHRSPLTYTRDRSGYDMHRELDVRVNGEGGRALRFGGGLAPLAPAGERWKEVASLALAGPSDRVYSLTADDRGRSTLHFGDGVHGARLPSGSNNVTATYRAGAGTNGNVGAGTLIALRKRPPGIRSATNPEPATGGANAETIAALRRRAPRKFDCCDRIVTLRDYEDFARGQRGVGHARAALTGTGGVLLTVVTSDWLPISEAPGLKAGLQERIEELRADRLTLKIGDPLIVLFNATLSIDLKQGADFVDVARRVRDALAAKFGFAARALGEGVDPQEVKAAARVHGVAAVHLTQLYRSTDEVGLGPLGATPAGTDSDGERPAEWLVINADSGLEVTHYG